MAAQPELPPPAANMDPQAPAGNDGACSKEEYKGWWVRGKEIYDYLQKLPKRVSAELEMGSLHSSLLRQWKSKVQNPAVVGEEVPAETLGALLLWIRQSETLIYYVTYRDKGDAVPGPTTPGILRVQEEPEMQQWHWPWIPGWDDPGQRARILNTNDKKWSTKKKVLVFGGVGLAAFIMGKKLLNTAATEY
jgi:hypothetical protein